jgi:hypothetical protein
LSVGALVGNKTGATWLGFALLPKHFELDARFPRHAGAVPAAAIDYMTEQVKVDPQLFAQYDWSGRSIKGHRAQVHTALGFREPTTSRASGASRSSGGREGAGRSYGGVTVRRKRQPDTTSR